MAAPLITLKNGTQIPHLGLGTWLSKPEEITEIVKYSIDIGYRLIDCAWVYGNEKEIGEGIQEKITDGTVKREDLCITTKLWNTFHEQENVVNACKESLKNLGLDYVDVYLVHWPCAQKNTGIFDSKLPFDGAVNMEYDYLLTWKGMEECYELGLAKNIGVANFNSNQVQRIMSYANIKPVIIQIEVNPLLLQKNLVKVCHDHSLQVMAYSPLGSPARTWKKQGDPFLDLQDPKLMNIGRKYGKTGSQVVLRYLIQRNVIVIPKSTNRERLKQNLNVFDFEITPEEMVIVESFDCNGRVVPALELKDSPNYPFECSKF